MTQSRPLVLPPSTEPQVNPHHLSHLSPTESHTLNRPHHTMQSPDSSYVKDQKEPWTSPDEISPETILTRTNRQAPSKEDPELTKPLDPSSQKLIYHGEPVIFEPLPNIRVSRSTYTVTSFIDLKPYLQQFESFADYFSKFLGDLMNPDKIVALRRGVAHPSYLDDGHSEKPVDIEGKYQSREDQPWCEDTFVFLAKRKIRTPFAVENLNSQEACHQFCKDEPTCSRFSWTPRTARIGCNVAFYNHQSEIDGLETTSNREDRVYTREACEENYFRGITPEQLVKEKNKKCTKFVCEVVRQYLDLMEEVLYIREVFNGIYVRFLEAIDADFSYGPHQEIRCTEINQETDKQIPERFLERYNLDDSDSRRKDRQADLRLPEPEQSALEALTNATDQLMFKYHPSYRQTNHTRYKRFGVLDLVLGWGVWSNRKAIGHLKHNIRELQDQNLLQDKQIKELTGWVNMTAHHVRLHQAAITQLDQRLLQTENHLKQIKAELEYFRQIWGITSSVRTAIIRLHSGLNSLRSNVDYVYDVIAAMATHKLTPLVLPRVRLQNVLSQIQR